MKTTESLAMVVVLLLALAGAIGLTGCSVAQLQAGLEAPTSALIETANKTVAGATQPSAIGSFYRYRIETAPNTEVSIYARENDNATANLLLIHGAGSGSWAWEFFFERLPQRFNVYAVNWRGHFDSSPVDDADSDDYVVDQMRALASIRERNKLPTHLVGHSYGGATAILQASIETEAVASVVLLAPVVPLDYTLAQRLIVPRVAPMFIKHGNDVEGVYGGMFLATDRMREYHERYAGQDYSIEKRGLIAKDGVSPEWQCALRNAFKTVVQRGVPVSMIIARYDNVVVPKRQYEIAKELNINTFTIESGHYIPLDIEADRTVQEVSASIDAVSQADSAGHFDD